jgi:4-carboxymuconolactone decarboxylase
MSAEPETRRERGLRLYRQVFGRGRSMIEADPLAEMTIDHLFADVWSREEYLSTTERSIITVALLAAQGRDDELRTHIDGAMNQGLRYVHAQEIMIHVAHYAGWAAGHHGLSIARQVDLERGRKTRPSGTGSV